MSTTTLENASPEADLDVDVVVVGAGFAGLFMAYCLREQGLRVQGIESADGVGGTWYWNSYPGARTDSYHYIYQLTFDDRLLKDWSYSERYPSRAELLSYLNEVADRFDLRSLFTFGTTVTSAVFDDQSGLWNVTTDAGTSYRATYVVTAVGLLSAPNVPPFPGRENFSGEVYHTSRWPQEPVDLAGKKVAVVGTGSSGIQVIPEVAKVAAHLTVFQRTPNFVVPTQNAPLTSEDVAWAKDRYDEIFAYIRQHPFAMHFADPGRNALEVSEEERQAVYEEIWQKGGLFFLFETFNDLQVNAEANETACEFIRGKIRSVVKDPATAELLSPRGYAYGAKRPPSGTGYYETFNRDNVSLVDVSTVPIEGFTETGLRTGEANYDFDVVILATGFDASSGSLLRMNVEGRNGLTLAEKWSSGPVTNMGLSVAGFPNFLMVTGPLAPFANIPTCIEENVGWINTLIEYMRKNEIRFVEAGESAEQAWVAHCIEVANMTFAASGAKVNTWFAGANIEGKPVAINVYFGGSNNYFDAADAAATDGYQGFVLTA